MRYFSRKILKNFSIRGFLINSPNINFIVMLFKAGLSIGLFKAVPLDRDKNLLFNCCTKNIFLIIPIQYNP